MRRVLLFLLCAVIGFTQLAAQGRVITGTVTDGKTPLSGATVAVVGATNTTTTDAEGKFSFSVPASARQLEVSFVGFTTQVVSIGTSTNLSVRLQAANESLSEVVVVAYGQQQKKAVTGAVSSISSDKIAKQQVVSATQALQGLASGVVVINTTGQPGENPTIRIRGIGSVNASAAPLVVVDGVPFDANLSNINPNDIESMNVLKDATATALYGSRAANGVILITTKTGKKGRDAAINVYSSYGVSSRAVPEYSFVSSEDYMKLAWEALKNQGTDIGNANPGQYASDRLINTVKYNPYGSAFPKPIDANGQLVPGATLLWDTDWSKEIRNSDITRKNVGLNVAGGTDRIRYFMSGDYLNQDGYVIKSNFQRISTRLNIDADLRDWLTVGVKTSVSSSKQNYPDQSGTAFRNAVQFGRSLASIYPLYMHDEQGKPLLDAFGNMQFDFGGPRTGRLVNVSRPVAQNTNAVAIQTLDQVLNERLLTSLNTYGEVRFTPNLKFRSSFGMDRYVFTNSNYQNPQYGDAAAVGGRVGKQRTLTTSWTWNNMLSYEKTFGDHTIGAMASSEAYDFKEEYFQAQKTGLPAPGLTELGPGATLESTNSYINSQRIVSYLGRVTYGFDNKYFAEATIRRDGSSRFLPDQRWGTFYALGGSWIMSSEKFLQDVTWLNMLKLRASYGEVGNNALTSYFPYLTSYATGYNDLTNPGVFLSGIANPDITWEKLGTFNVGFDFAVLKNRLSGSIEYYNKKTFDLLFPRPLPNSSGITTVSENIGEVSNKGIELNLTSRNITNKNFSWETNFNLATVKNRITKLPQEKIVSGSYRMEVGQSLNDFWIYEWAGVNPANGAPQWYKYELDAQGNSTDKRTVVNTIAGATRRYFGTSIPKVTGGLSNNFTYKNFDASFLFNYAFGGKILDADYISLMHGFTSMGNQLHTDILNRWQKPGDVTDVPRLKIGNSEYGNPSTRHLFSGDYIRLRNVTLGYTLPAQTAEAIGFIKSLRVYVQADNFFTWTKAKEGLDPEVSIGGVTSQSSSSFKTLSAGLNVGF